MPKQLQVVIQQRLRIEISKLRNYEMKCLTKYYMNKGENIANEAIEWLKHADLNVYLISYIMISKHFNLDITICFTQFFANESINMLEILKPLGFDSLDS